MAVFWLGLYVFVNLTSIIWLGSIAVTQVMGVDQNIALVALGLFALLYQLKGGLKAVAMTDIVQVTLLVTGGLLVSALTLRAIGGGHGIVAGFHTLQARVPDHFHMILTRDNPFYKDLPGISVLLGLFWKRASEAGALVAALASFALSIAFKAWLPGLPFMARMLVVFAVCLALAVAASLVRPAPAARNVIATGDVDYRTSTSFNVAAIGVAMILVALYATWW